MNYRMHPQSVCPIHDEHLDPETDRCDHCDREAALEDCPRCGGDGVIIATHPDHGTRDCEDPEIEETCHHCSGTGVTNALHRVS